MWVEFRRCFSSHQHILHCHQSIHRHLLYRFDIQNFTKGLMLVVRRVFSQAGLHQPASSSSAPAAASSSALSSALAPASFSALAPPRFPLLPAGPRTSVLSSLGLSATGSSPTIEPQHPTSNLLQRRWSTQNIAGRLFWKRRPMHAPHRRWNWRSKWLEGKPFMKGVCTKVYIKSPKKPNSML